MKMHAISKSLMARWLWHRLTVAPHYRKRVPPMSV